METDTNEIISSTGSKLSTTSKMRMTPSGSSTRTGAPANESVQQSNSIKNATITLMAKTHPKTALSYSLQPRLLVEELDTMALNTLVLLFARAVGAISGIIDADVFAWSLHDHVTSFDYVHPMGCSPGTTGEFECWQQSMQKQYALLLTWVEVCKANYTKLEKLADDDWVAVGSEDHGEHTSARLEPAELRKARSEWDQTALKMQVFRHEQDALKLLFSKISDEPNFQGPIPMRGGYWQRDDNPEPVINQDCQQYEAATDHNILQKPIAQLIQKHGFASEFGIDSVSFYTPNSPLNPSSYYESALEEDTSDEDNCDRNTTSESSDLEASYSGEYRAGDVEDKEYQNDDSDDEYVAVELPTHEERFWQTHGGIRGFFGPYAGPSMSKNRYLADLNHKFEHLDLSRSVSSRAQSSKTRSTSRFGTSSHLEGVPREDSTSHPLSYYRSPDDVYADIYKLIDKNETGEATNAVDPLEIGDGSITIPEVQAMISEGGIPIMDLIDNLDVHFPDTTAGFKALREIIDVAGVYDEDTNMVYSRGYTLDE